MVGSRDRRIVTPSLGGSGGRRRSDSRRRDDRRVRRGDSRVVGSLGPSVVEDDRGTRSVAYVLQRVT